MYRAKMEAVTDSYVPPETVPDYDMTASEDVSQAHEASSGTAIDEGYQTGHAPGDRTPTQSFQLSQSQNKSTQESDVAALDRLGRGVKKFVEAINELRHLGVEDLVLPLPKIVIVGDQSTGKSSLIEAISEIKVPRNVGTCTRCPLEINLTENTAPDAEWLCKVSLHKKFVYDPPRPDFAGGYAAKRRAALPTRVSRARPFGHFVEQEPVELFFTEIKDKAEVGNALKWAQLATLNPHQDHRIYVPGNNHHTEENIKEKFSPNVVRLDISGPSLPNLSFYDLPGVINQAENDDERHLVHLVKNLVKDYIKADNSLVLLAIPMTDDAANSSAAAIVREMKAEGRCVGVLTKPDRVQTDESFEQWRNILNGNRYPVGHGYFVTKQPGQALIDSGIEHQEARASEAEFFSNQAPWATEFLEFSEKFGTVALQSALSQKLTRQIQASLPRINEQVQSKAVLIETELQLLPEPPADNPLMRLVQKIQELLTQIGLHLDGGYPYNDLHKAWNDLAVGFRNTLVAGQPGLVITDGTEKVKRRQQSVTPRHQHGRDPSSQGTPTPARFHTDAIELSSEDEEETPTTKTEPGSHSSKRSFGASPAAFKKRRAMAAPVTPFPGKPFTLPEIRNSLRDGYTTGIPGQVDPKAIDRLSRNGVSHWGAPLDDFLDKTVEVLREQIFDRLSDVFSPWRQTGLYVETTSVINVFLDSLCNAQRNAAHRVLYLEQCKPMTLNEDALEAARKEALEFIQAKRREYRVNVYIDNQEAKGVRGTEGQERLNKAAKITDAQIGPDPFAKEVEVVATVRGYYKIAMFRFLDSICQSVHGELFSRCRSEMGPELEKGLGYGDAGAEERFARLMTEHPEREIKRAQLKKEKAMLGKAQDWLAKLV
ncbi:MAG: hypothetical protein M1817_003124 [Caeruleum heppii]|nr:MAG: hypothetical protein M1817_003124 [Caeruleum heppii]